jgi:hypothetical protein
MFVPVRYVVYEHDVAKPWLVVATSYVTVDLPNPDEFADWARQQWPASRYTVELEPGRLPRLMR